jgi:hypothetical protein
MMPQGALDWSHGLSLSPGERRQNIAIASRLFAHLTSLGHIPRDMAIAAPGNFGKNSAVNAAEDRVDVAESFFWQPARAAPCCPAARNSMKNW